MWVTVLNVVYVLIAIAMIALILMQRGSGAQAGAGFGGGGASGTVFGARGASNFLSKSTKWLAIAFFGISLGMAWYATHRANPPVTTGQPDLGLMGQVPAAPATTPAAPASNAPAATTPPASTPTDGTVPAAPAAQPQPAPQDDAVPAAAPAETVPAAPATGGNGSP